MHYQTAVECYVVLRRAAQFKEEAIDLLLGEVRASQLLSEAERTQLVNALTTIRQTGSFGDTPAVEQIWSVLVKHAQFQKERATVIASILAGTRDQGKMGTD